MTSKHLHPALDTDGWVKTPIKVADYMLSHFFLADKSQTAFFPTEVVSFSWILQTHPDDMIAIRTTLQEELARYFSKQFSNVDIEVSEIAASDSINKRQLTLYLAFYDGDGIGHNLSRIIKYSGLKVTEIISVNNNG